jgi:hypothetical protein
MRGRLAPVSKSLPDCLPQRLGVERLLQGRPTGVGVPEPAAAITCRKDERDAAFRERVGSR